MSEPKVVKLVTFGNGSDSVYYAPQGTSVITGSGYGTPEKPHASNFESKSDVIVPDGTPVIDKSIKGCNIMAVINGPMVDVSLEDDEVNYCPSPSPELSAGLRGDFNVLAQKQETHRKKLGKKIPGPLDSVSISEYIKFWRYQGARIGHYENRKIVWDTHLPVMQGELF